MKTIKSILTILLSGYLILSMGGFSVFHHLCNCSIEENNNTSIFFEQSCCSSDVSEPIGCHFNTDQNTCGDVDCDSCNCETEVEVLTVNESLTVENNRLSNPIVILSTLLGLAYEDESTDLTADLTNTDNALLPPKPGKSIIILHQSLKIPFRT
jgi:hypothetical protein